MWQKFSESARQSILNAQTIAVGSGSNSVDTAHLFLGVLDESSEDSIVAVLLGRSGVSMEEARLYAQSSIEKPAQQEAEPKLTAAAKHILELAADEARRLNSPTIETVHLFMACVRQQKFPHVGEVLRPLGLELDALRNYLRDLSSPDQPYKEGNPLNELTQSGEKAIEAAHMVMRASYCGRISTAHLLLGLLSDDVNAAVETLTAANVDIEQLRTLARAQILSGGEVATPQKKFTPAAKRALERARGEARRCSHTFIGPEHLLGALLPRTATVREKLAFGSPVEDPLEKVWAALPTSTIQQRYEELWGPPVPPPKVVKPQKPPAPFQRKSALFGVTCFALAMVWVGLMSSSQGRTAFGGILIWVGLIFLVGSGLIACATMLFSRSEQTKSFFLSGFVGYLLGLFCAMFLLKLH